MQPIARAVQRTIWRSRMPGSIIARMINVRLMLLTVMFLLSLLWRPYGGQNAKPQTSGPEYTGDGQLKFPEQYREWVYVTTGFDMSYNPAMSMGHHMFDNVFVNPEAYKVFVETGSWPDKTVMVLEARAAVGKGSINQVGNYQGTEVHGLEVHVKDSRFPGKWAFFMSHDGKTAEIIPTSTNCYSCHADHAAVDTTFVQFYPTLLPIAKSKGTLAAAYLKEVSAQK